MPSGNKRIEHLKSLQAKSRLGGGEKRIARQHEKGKLTARERIAELLDPASFHELEPFVAQDAASMEDFETVANGVVTGYGQINGRKVFVYAQDFTVMGGSLGEMQGHKICRVMDLAAQNGAPIIGLIDSGGARIQEGVQSLKGYAEIFRRNALYSGVVPQISLILGPCAGGAAYSPALTDFIFMVEKRSHMFITGPSVIKEVTGEEIDFESLGGTQVHMTISGVASLSAQDEVEALSLCRQLLSYLPANNAENPPAVAPGDDPFRTDEYLNTIVPEDDSRPYSMHDVIHRIVDQNSFFEIQPAFATNADEDQQWKKLGLNARAIQHRHKAFAIRQGGHPKVGKQATKTDGKEQDRFIFPDNGQVDQEQTEQDHDHVAPGKGEKVTEHIKAR